LSLFIGIAASAIGFTAWPLVVPILFVLCGFNLYLTILTSLLIDCGNALVISVIAMRHQQVDVKKALLLSCFAAIWIAAGIMLGRTFIPNNENFFRGSAGIITIIIGCIFILKGFRTGQKETPQSENKNVPNQPRDGNTITTNQSSSSKIRPHLIYLGVAIMAFQVGFFGIGGGMGYAIFLMLFLSFPIIKATGTAMMMTFFSTILAAIGIFFQVPQGALMQPGVLQFILLMIGLSMVGTMFGAKITYSLSEKRINYLIGSIVILAGVIATAQKFFIQFFHNQIL